jgi:small subunit ribosomal protein S18
MPKKRQKGFRRRRRVYERVPKFCSFCKQGEEPDYKNVLVLRRFITDRGKILPRSRSGICAKHQRRLKTAIKRARILTLLPFIRR